jgi:hypothetical protein
MKSRRQILTYLLFAFFLLINAQLYSQSQKAIGKIFSPEIESNLSLEQMKYFNYEKNKETNKKVKLLKLIITQTELMSASSIIFDIFGNEISFKIKEIRTNRDSSISLIGQTNGNELYLTIAKNDITASLTIDNRIYAIVPIGNKIHSLLEIDLSKYKPEEEPIMIEDFEEGQNNLQKAQQILTSDSDVDILVAYTPAASSVVSNMSTLINNAISQINSSFSEGGIGVTYHLACSTEVNIIEGNKSSAEILDEFDSNITVTSLRDEYRADLCFLITNSPNVSGRGYTPPNPTPWTSSSGFAIGNYDYVRDNKTFSHETGHNFGAHHNLEAPNMSYLGYKHGYLNVSADFCTIMAYWTTSPSQRKNIWSDPYNTWGVHARGVVDTSENVRWLNDQRADIESYRTFQTSGTISSNHHWRRDISLIGDVQVNATLTIESDCNVNLNGYSIRCTGSGIIKKYGNVSGYTNYAKYGSNYKGFFPSSVSIAQILSWSSSGWNVNILAGTYPQNDHLIVSSDRTLTLHSGVNINFSGSYKLDVYGSLNCEGSSGSNVTINGQNYSRSSYSNSMVDIKSGASADIDYTSFINSPYHLIVRNSADAEISHSTFSNFGFSTSSRAVTIYYSTGDVSIYNCTFTGSGSKGIGVYSNNTGTNVTIADNTFSNCRYAIRCYSSDALISGNTIPSYYYYGIYSDNVSYGAKYWENEITGNFSSYGVYLNSSTPYFFKNTLNQSKMLINSCSPNFYDPTGPVCLKGYNTIHNAGAPLIKVQNYSTPYLGYGLEESGYNSIYETDLPHMWITNYSGAYADNNYWGQEGPANYADGTSWFLDRWPLSFNPNLNKLGESSFEDFSIREDEKEDEEEFMAALDAGFKLDYVKAKERLNNLIYRETTSRFPALSVLMYDYFTKRELQDEKSSRDENVVINELTVLVDDLCKKEVGDPLRAFGLKISARESSLNKDYNSLSNFNSQIIAEYPNSIHEMTSLFDEISYQVEVKEDFAKAKELLLRMDKAYPDENLTLMAHVVLGENVDLYDSKLPKVAESKEALYIPASFKMHPAFPNPFNPATTIKYELPKDVHVKLSVYNINGQKILDLVKGYQVAGVHEIVFNGSNLSSGMYFYMISAGDFSDVKRLLLIK